VRLPVFPFPHLAAQLIHLLKKVPFLVTHLKQVFADHVLLECLLLEVYQIKPASLRVPLQIVLRVNTFSMAIVLIVLLVLLV